MSGLNKTIPQLTIVKGDNHDCDKPDCAYCRFMRDGIYRKNDWHPSQLFILENEYGKTKIEELEKILNRSRQAIYSKISVIRNNKI